MPVRTQGHRLVGHRSPRQIGALFDRRTEVFPPPGIDIGDRFFARQRPTEEHPGRRCVQSSTP
jgi:hypothetical protein